MSFEALCSHEEVRSRRGLPRIGLGRADTVAVSQTSRRHGRGRGTSLISATNPLAAVPKI
eukprot:7662183-Pyramimonas_sp.AAC.1